MKLPPACPPFRDAATELAVRYEQFVGEFGGALHGAALIDWHKRGVELASDLQAEAMGLEYDRVREGSIDVYWLKQCAVVVAYLMGGKNSPLFARYYEALGRYRTLQSTAHLVQCLDAYINAEA